MSLIIPSEYNIILGSSSQFRQSIMNSTTLNYKIYNPDINEKEIRDDDAKLLVQKICIAKGNVF